MFNTSWKKIFRDLWGNRGRTILVILAISVGVFSFGGVFMTRTLLLKGMDKEFSDSNPWSIRMSIDNFNSSLVEWTKNQEGVSGATGRVVHSIKLVNKDKTETINLYAYKDYQNITIAKIVPQKGIWPPGKGEIVIERGSLSLVEGSLGDNITILLPDDKEKRLKFVGTVFDISAIPARFFPQITSYVSLSTLDLLDLSQNYNELLIKADTGYTDLKEIDQLAGSIKKRLEERGVTVRSVETREPDQHWGKAPSQAFVTILSGIGVVTLIMTGFLVINTVTSLITQQKRQIGIMKAVGASRRKIAQIYLATVIFYGLAALLIAIPLGLILSYLNLKVVTNFLNTDIVNFHLPLNIFIMMFVASLLVPIIASLFPILSGLKVTVREAVQEGASLRFSNSLVDKIIYKVGILPRPLLLSLRNSFRDKRRLLLTLGTLSLAGTLFVSVINLRGSFLNELNRIIKRDNFNVRIYFQKPYAKESLEKKVMSIEGVTKAETLATYSGQRIKEDGSKGGSFSINGVNPKSDFLIPNISGGRWLESTDKNGVVVAREVVKNDPGFDLGKLVTLDINGKKGDWLVVGIIQLLGQGNLILYANQPYLSKIQGDANLASTLNIRTTNPNPSFELEIAQKAENLFEDSGFRVGQTFTMGELKKSNVSMFDFLVGFLLSMAFLVAIVGALSLAGTMSLNVLERTREIGIMRGIGASNSVLRQTVLFEGLFIGVISWIIAIPLSIPVTYAFTIAVGFAFMGAPMPFNFAPAGIIIWLVLVMVISTAASLLPSQKAVSISVRDALSYE